MPYNACKSAGVAYIWQDTWRESSVGGCQMTVTPYIRDTDISLGGGYYNCDSGQAIN